jgi:hypothetical protein
MTVSMELAGATDGYEVVQPGPVVAAGHAMTLLRRNSVQPSRRAVLHVCAARDAAVPAQLVSWYTERAFQFYLAGMHLPAALGVADLDAAGRHLRDAEGMDTVIVTAYGRDALATARWAQASRSAGPDALILLDPVLPGRRRVKLSIPCPVLVLTDGAGRRNRPAFLGGHVTWLQLRGEPGRPLLADGAHLHVLFAELGRWLGAYMYGQRRDQLL